MDFIDAHRERFGVEPVCRVLTEHGCKIAPNTYWVHKKRPPSARTVRDEYLKVEIARVHAENLSVYGADRCGPSSTARASAWPAVERLMRELGLSGGRRAERSKSPPAPTTSDQNAPARQTREAAGSPA